MRTWSHKSILRATSPSEDTFSVQPVHLEFPPLWPPLWTLLKQGCKPRPKSPLCKKGNRRESMNSSMTQFARPPCWFIGRRDLEGSEAGCCRESSFFCQDQRYHGLLMSRLKGLYKMRKLFDIIVTHHSSWVRIYWIYWCSSKNINQICWEIGVGIGVIGVYCYSKVFRFIVRTKISANDIWNEK